MNKKIKGFTLIELLVVIAIVGILSGLIIVSMSSAINAAKDAKIKSDIGTITKAILVYAANNNSYPSTDTYPCTIGGGTTRCTNLESNLASYLTAIPKDPSGGFYAYSYSGTGPTFTLTSTLSSGNTYTYSSATYFSETPPWICGSSTLIDSRNSRTYNTVLIGTQCWTKENMDYNINNCTSITWMDTDAGSCSYYTGGPFASEGLLYQWSAAMNGSATPGAQGICPTGWHIPTDAEWTTLTTYLGNSTAGTQLKSGGTSGFNSLMTGYRESGSSFQGRSSYTSFWSSSPSSPSAWFRSLSNASTSISRSTCSKTYGFSVRCLKN
jgi:type II secretion system protein G